MIPLKILKSYEKRKAVFGYVVHQHHQCLRPVFNCWFSTTKSNSPIAFGTNNNNNNNNNNNSNNRNCNNSSYLLNCRKYTINNNKNDTKISYTYLTPTTATTTITTTRKYYSGFNKQLSTLNLKNAITTTPLTATSAKTPFSLINYRHAFDTKSPDPTKKPTGEDDIFGEASKLGLFAKFKLMYKKYWYVLIPVHVVTSLGWLGSFYYMSQSGVDVPALLEHLHMSETVIHKVQNSNMGHVAIAYLCYKVMTPLRYAVTLGGTTISIKYLVQWGYIKPLPTKRELMRMYERKRADRAAAKAIRESHEKSK